MLIVNKLRGVSVIFLGIGTHLIIPKISEVTLNFHQILSQQQRAIATEAALEDRKKLDKDSSTSTTLNNQEFQPPNNGGFDSDYGSGTR
ncbi:MAG: hypothetical protein AAF378_20270 [Cyanobacteria bacterium P01_A01_bin.84]